MPVCWTLNKKTLKTYLYFWLSNNFILKYLKLTFKNVFQSCSVYAKDLHRYF